MVHMVHMVHMVAVCSDFVMCAARMGLPERYAQNEPDPYPSTKSRSLVIVSTGPLSTNMLTSQVGTEPPGSE